MAKVTIKLRLKEDFKKLLKNPKFLDHLGTQVVIEMRKQIAVGLSPVRGVGRFAEYKAVANAREANKARLGLRRVAKRALEDDNRRVAGRAFNLAQDSANQLKRAKGGYPYNVMDEYPDKQVRPVNLKLSGDMLDALTFYKTSSGIVVGIFDATELEKASKHQTGDPAKGLAKRRFVPASKGEEFTVTLTRLIRDLYRDALFAILKGK